jgi:transposase
MKAEKLIRRQYDEVFKRDAVALVTEHGYKLSEAGRRLGVNSNLIGRWKVEFEQDASGQRLTADERVEMNQLRRRVRELEMETEILKKATAYFAKLSK